MILFKTCACFMLSLTLLLQPMCAFAVLIEVSIPCCINGIWSVKMSHYRGSIQCRRLIPQRDLNIRMTNGVSRWWSLVGQTNEQDATMVCCTVTPVATKWATSASVTSTICWDQWHTYNFWPPGKHLLRALVHLWTVDSGLAITRMIVNGGSWYRMFDDQDGREWGNVSSGTGLPG